MQILTSKGFRDFQGFASTGIKIVGECDVNGRKIKCTPDHRFLINGRWVTADSLDSFSLLNEPEEVFDAINVSDGHEYLTNGISSHNCLILDEFAFIPQNQAEAFFESVYPTISSGTKSKISVFSTPKGMNHFYKMWKEATEGSMINGKIVKSDFTPIKVAWNSVPGRDEAWKAKTIADVGQATWDQEYEGMFIGAVGTLIPSSVVAQFHIAKPFVQHAHTKIYEKPKEGHTYFSIVDVAGGTGGDYSVVNVIDITSLPYKQVAVYRNNLISYLALPAIVYGILKEYNDSYVLTEINNEGRAVADDLAFSYEYENVMTTGGRGKVSLGSWVNSVNGIRTTTATKKTGCSLLRNMLESGNLLVVDYDTVHEMTTFVAKGKSYEAEAGANDDIMMTLVIFAWAENQAFFKELTKADFKAAYLEKSRSMMLEDLSPIGFFDGMNDDEFVLT